MMDERLIGEVQKHAIIYNRQKSNMMNGDKSANKELAWTKIAISLSTDPDSCKKRWKYLRERYVQQKKVGDSPSYEHLSRPYLEKMKFLDHFIQPRKSYRNVGHLLSSPNHSQHSIMDGGSNEDRLSVQMTVGSFQNEMNAMGGMANAIGNSSGLVDHNGAIDESAVYQHYYRLNNLRNNCEKIDENLRHLIQPDLIKNEPTNNITSSSSSLISSQPSPSPLATSSSHAEQLDESVAPPKRRRTSISILEHNNHHDLHSTHHNSNNSNNDQMHHLSDDNEEQSSTNNDVGGNDSEQNNRSPPFPSDLLYPFYQHAHQQRQQVVRHSEHLLGELVTSELLKMTKERKKIVQKKILQILFFED